MDHCQEFIDLHAIAKKIAKHSEKNQDFIAELDTCDFDILLVSDSWRDRREDAIVTAAGHKVFLSGGSRCRNGVGICVSRRLLDQISGLTIFAISDKICCIHFTRSHCNFRTFSCYMPTSWEPNPASEHACDRAGTIPILETDFNAVIRNPLPGDDMGLLGTCGFGPRNDRGWMFVRWVLEHGLFRIQIFDTTTVGLANVPWMRVQMDYILSPVHGQI